MINNYHTRDFSHNDPQNLVVILHGYGADASNLVDLSDFFAPDISNSVFIVPDAPFPHEYMPDMGRQWFSLMNRDEDALIQGAETARIILLQFLEQKLQSYNLQWKDLTFIGFSQGTMMALYTALKLKEQCKAVIGFSGTMVSAEETIASCQSKPPVCLVHGSDDAVVPFTLGKFTSKVLKQNGFAVDFHEIPHLEHSIDMQGIKLVKSFLQSIA